MAINLSYVALNRCIGSTSLAVERTTYTGSNFVDIVFGGYTSKGRPRFSTSRTPRRVNGDQVMTAIANLRGMRKSSGDKKLAGVCGGLGQHTALPSWLWRVVFLSTIFIAGMGLIAYVALWIFMPAADPLNDRATVETYPTLRSLKKSKQNKVIGGICGGLGENTTIPAWLWRAIFVIAIFAYGIGLIAYLVLWVSLPPTGLHEISSPDP
jgi:phage shock protein PspC (stress-responsive transcriptional regulator)